MYRISSVIRRSFFLPKQSQKSRSILQDRSRSLGLFRKGKIGIIAKFHRTNRGDQIFFSVTCPGQVACKNPLVLRNFLLVPKYFSNRKSIGQVANATISLPLNQSCR